MNRRRAGFTLVEVMIALAIMSLVMVALYSTLNATLRARDQIEIESRVARLGPQILDIIEDDLRRAWIADIEGDRVFKGEARTIDGESADSLSFLTSVDSGVSRRIDDEEIFSDVCETGYRLRRNPELPDVFELWRRQSFHVDEEPLKDGVYELLHDRVVHFQLRYLEHLDPYLDELNDWDASLKHGLPAAVSIDLALEAVPRTLEDLGRENAASRTLTYHRIVPLTDHSQMIMRVHPITPTFTAVGADGGAGQGGPDTDGDGVTDANDPAPNDPNVPVPNGAGDDDGDGEPNGSDPAPNDPTIPGDDGDQGPDDGTGDPDDPFGGGGGDGGDLEDFFNQLLGGGGG